MSVQFFRMARHGINVGDVQSPIMTAIGGMNLTTTVEGRKRYPVRARYMRELRDNADAIKRIFVDSPFGYKVPLGQLAQIEKVLGPAKIASEDTLPFAFIGRIWLQFLLGYKFSTAVWVGYIALFGVAVEAGIFMVKYLQQWMDRQVRDKPLKETVIKGALLQIRPIVMTTATIILALMAVMFATGTGSEVMKPVAVPTVGGIVTATMTNLILVLILFYWMKRRNTNARKTTARNNEVV